MAILIKSLNANIEMNTRTGGIFSTAANVRYFYSLFTFRGVTSLVAKFIWLSIIPLEHRVFLLNELANSPRVVAEHLFQNTNKEMQIEQSKVKKLTIGH